jgi:hypothetical protein
MKTMKTCKMGCGKMKAGGPVKKIRKMKPGGEANFGMPFNGLPFAPTNGNTDISKNQMGTNPTMKKGGATKNAKLAAMAAPKNKITRADIITAIKKKAKKK